MRVSLRLILASAGGAVVGGLAIAWLQHPPGGSVAAPRLAEQPAPEEQTQPGPPDFAVTFPALPDQSREFRRLDAAAVPLRQELTQQLWQATDDAVRLTLLDQLESECYAVELIELVRAALTAPGWGEAARLRAVDLLAGNLDPAILSALEVARRAPEENLRAAAVLAAARVGSGFTDYALPALGDNSAAVRLSVLEAATAQSDAVQTRLRGAALQGRHADAALRAVGELLVEAAPASLPALFTGLDAPLPEVREETRLALDFLFDQEFASAAAAAAWWTANRHRFDADLVLKNP
jgi:hypothetical protein